MGWKEDYVGHATLDVSCNSVAGFTLLFRKPVLVEHLRTETRFTKSPLLIVHGVVSGLSVTIPLKEPLLAFWPGTQPPGAGRSIAKLVRAVTAATNCRAATLLLIAFFTAASTERQAPMMHQVLSLGNL